MKKDTINKVEKYVSMLMKIALQNEAQNQLPRVALLMTKSPTSTVEKILEWVPQIEMNNFLPVWSTDKDVARVGVEQGNGHGSQSGGTNAIVISEQHTTPYSLLLWERV